MEYDPSTALVVVDVQNDFADPMGSLSVAGGEAVIPFINEQIALAGAAGSLVVYTQDWHPETTPHFAKDGGIWPVHCVAGTNGAALHSALHVSQGARRIQKGTGGEDGFSGFTVRDPETSEEKSTGLVDLLKGAGVERVVLLGLALDYCVKDTALDAAALGFETTVLADGTRPVNLSIGDGARATAALVLSGVAVE